MRVDDPSKFFDLMGPNHITNHENSYSVTYTSFSGSLRTSTSRHTMRGTSVISSLILLSEFQKWVVFA